MKDKKILLINLLSMSNEYVEILKRLKNENFEFHSFEKTKNDFLNIYEPRLEINRKLGVKVNGLDELIQNFKIFDSRKVVINSIEGQNMALAIFTDIDYTRVFGII